MKTQDIEYVRSFDAPRQRDEWEDEDENDGEWPYPTKHVRRELDGALAYAVRRRCGPKHGNLPVYITTDEISTGYCEYTQETEFNTRLECGDVSVEFYSTYGEENNLVKIIEWLDKA